MTHVFDAEQRAKFFDTVFAPVQLALVQKGEVGQLHPRDHLLLAQLAEAPAQTRILDYGCGQGRLLGELLRRGWDAYGYEPSTGMAGVAREHFLNAPAERLVTGTPEVLTRWPAGHFDVVILMGVTQYLSDAEVGEVMQRCRALLAPGGRLFVTFQNGLFDLFTFNKYTVDAVTHMLLGGLVSDEERVPVEKALEGLLTHATMPAHAASRARDNVFVRLSNPLSIRQDLGRFGLACRDLWFYEWFGLPPLIAAQAPQTAARIKAEFEVVNAQDWRGHFMANAFLVEASPIS